ncbi:MAG: glycosyltransferase family 4 protein [bacterium]
MKIVFVIPSLGTGGAERIVSLLSKIFFKNGYEVYIIIFHEPIKYGYEGRLIDINVPHTSNFLKKPFIFLRRLFSIRTHIKAIKPDLIISFLETANIPTVFANMGYKYKHIISIQNNPDRFSFYHKWFLHFYRYAYKVVVVSNAIKHHMMDRYKMRNIEVIYNSINLEEIDYMLKDKLPESIKIPYILMVGRLTYQKGIDILIRAFYKAFKDAPVNLVIAGEGKDRFVLEQLVKTLHLENKVFLIGNVQNPFILYKNALFLVLSSRWEGFANVLVEALACSCPVIASNCPYGPSEVLEDGEYGILVPPEDESALANAMKLMYENVELRKKFSEKAFRRAEAFDLKHIYKKWLI